MQTLYTDQTIHLPINILQQMKTNLCIIVIQNINNCHTYVQIILI